MTEPQGNSTNQPTGQGQSVQPGTQNIARQPSEGQEQQPTYVTRAELEAALAKFTANSQSAIGKMEDRLSKKLQTLQAAGIQATPQQAQALLDSEQQGAPQQSPQGQPAASQPPAQGAPAPTSPDTITTTALAWMKEDGMANPDPVNLEGYRIMAEAGIRLKDGDPELAEIDPKADPETWKAQVRVAVAKAKARIEKGGSPARMPAAASGQPSGQPSHAGKTGTQTLDDYFNTLSFK